VESFKKLTLRRWRQFEDVELDLTSHLCVLTGPNGSGKTTVLNVLGKHFGWNLQFLTASFLSEKQRRRVYDDAWEALTAETPQANVVGTITYSNDVISELSAPAHPDNARYDLRYLNQQKVEGLHIPSHRPPPSFQRIEQIPIDPKTSQQHYTQYQTYLFATYGESPQRNPASAMKETLIAFAVFGEGNSAVQPNEEYQQVFASFQEILSKLLPAHIGFRSIEVRSPDVVLKTATGDFPLEAMSGGLNALFGIAWQIHTYGFDKTACTVLIDEPENHLHPSMQRDFLPRLSAAFPTYNFIVSSHSPFVVSSKPDAAVYALVYNENQRVVSQRLHEADLAGSPNKVLREILDVPVTMPIWVESRIEAVLAKYAGRAGDADTVRQIRADLDSQGLGSAVGDFLVQHRDSLSSRTEKE
jgi:predicted ATPase